MKTTLINIFDTSNRILVSYKFRKTVEKKSRDKSIMVFKQDMGRGVALIDRKIYTGKYLNLLHTESFIQLDHDPIKAIKRNFKRPYVKSTTNWLKHNLVGFTQQGHHQNLWHSQTAQIKNCSSVSYLPLRPIIGTALYQLTKYLPKLFSPLSKSQYKVNSTKELTDVIKNEIVSSAY